MPRGGAQTARRLHNIGVMQLENILVGTDLSPDRARAVEHAAYLAATYGAHLHIVHARLMFEELYDLESLPNQEELQEAVERAAGRSVDAVRPRFQGRITRAVVPTPSAAAGIVEYARDHHVDLVVVGTHGRGGLSRALLGSVAQTVVRMSPVSVLVVGKDMEHVHGYRNILCGVDFSQESKQAFAQAVALVRKYGGMLRVAHVAETVAHPAFYQAATSTVLDLFPTLREQAERELAAMLGEHPDVRSEVVVAEGRAHRRLPQLAREYASDLLVVGSTGLGRLERLLLGHVVERILPISPCPVWVAKGGDGPGREVV